MVIRHNQWGSRTLVRIHWSLQKGHYVSAGLGQMRRIFSYLSDERNPCTKTRVQKMGNKWALIMNISDDVFRIGRIGLGARVR